ncbi:MAG: hypothetical protein Q4B86_02155 [Eubacteriales bacterium]|nr:hypothetical protein [Eubacteriales bacterium]
MKEQLELIIDLFRKIRLGYIRIHDLINYLLQDKNKKTLELFKNQLFILFREISPKKGKGYIKFGSGDPYNTGRVMEAAAVLYPYYESFTEVIPVFDEACIEVKQQAKGRIRLFVLIKSAIKIFTSKELREIYKHFCIEADGFKQDIKAGEG